MSTLSLRLPKALHAWARPVAAEDEISINQLITLALAEKRSVLKTKAYCEQRAPGGRWVLENRLAGRHLTMVPFLIHCHSWPIACASQFSASSSTRPPQVTSQ